MADTLDIEALTSQMNEAVEEIVSLQKEFLKKAEEIEAKKEHVNKLDGAIWALKMERESADAESQDSNGIPKVATTADN
jgi:chromosome segregation ATPase